MDQLTSSQLNPYGPMIKSSKKINVSQAIREYLQEDPDLTPAVIVERLAKEHKVRVTAQYVSTIKSNTKRKERNTVSSEYDSLLAAKSFIQQAGGVQEALQLLDDYRALVD